MPRAGRVMVWVLLAVAGLAGAAGYVLYACSGADPAEIPIPSHVSDDQAWDNLLISLSRCVYVERAVRDALDGTGVLYTGWVRRLGGEEMPGRQARIVVVLDRPGRKVRILAEAQRLQGEQWVAEPADDVVDFVRHHIRLVGAVPQPPAAVPVPT